MAGTGGGLLPVATHSRHTFLPRPGPYDPRDLDNLVAHLTNLTIQEKAANYSQVQKDNVMSYASAPQEKGLAHYQVGVSGRR